MTHFVPKCTVFQEATVVLKIQYGLYIRVFPPTFMIPYSLEVQILLLSKGLYLTYSGYSMVTSTKKV